MTIATYGGWSKFRPLTDEDKMVFDEAMNGLVGVDYDPLLVSTQVVAGLNYKFLCNATVVAPNAETTHKMVYIFKPLDGKAVIDGIQAVA